MEQVLEGGERRGKSPTCLVRSYPAASAATIFPAEKVDLAAGKSQYRLTQIEG
jgi:hypothetical protein